MFQPFMNRNCHICGTAHAIPEIGLHQRAECVSCGATLAAWWLKFRDNRISATLALSALLLYIPAVYFPIIVAERFGYVSEKSVLQGTLALFEDGHTFAGLVVLLCSIVWPLVKLSTIFLLLAEAWLKASHRAWALWIIESTGKWALLDVLLVAIIISVMTLGDFAEVRVGPAFTVFTASVILNILAAQTLELYPKKKES